MVEMETPELLTKLREMAAFHDVCCGCDEGAALAQAARLIERQSAALACIPKIAAELRQTSAALAELIGPALEKEPA